MSFYGALASTALKLIGKYGKTVTLTGQAATVIDPNKPWRGSSGTVTSASPKAVVTTFTADEISGELIVQSDLKMLVAAADLALIGFELRLLSTATVDGTSYGAVLVETVKPGDTALLYVVRLRQG